MIDAHAHLTDVRFAADLDGVIGRARDAGLTRILTCGEDVASSEAAVALAARYPHVRVAVGIHPHRATSCDDAALGRLAALARDERVVAIGETGVDLSGRSASLADQQRAFTAQLALAAKLALPVVIHVRDAGAVVLRLLEAATGVRGQLHCYSEGPDEIGHWVARGLYVSFAGTVTFPRNGALRLAARRVPADRLLVETDAPYLAPEPYRGRRNEPAFVLATVARIAELRGLAAPALAEQVAANAASLFGARW